MTKNLPWAFLDEFRGTVFNGEWPTVPELFTVTMQRFPHAPCFTDFEGPDDSKRVLTYCQVMWNVQELSRWMIEQGIKKGDKIALSRKNSPEWGIVYLAALFASAIVVPLDYALHEYEIDNLLKVAEPKLFFVDEEKYEYYKDNFLSLGVYSLSPAYMDDFLCCLMAEGEVTANPPAVSGDTAAILFTSGTTSTPKGVMLTHENLVSDCFIAQLNFNHYHTDVFYALLPLHHAYTMQAAFINPLSTGAQIVFGKSMAVTRLMRDLSEGEITVMLGVPLLYNKLLAGIKKGIRDKGAAVAGLMGFLMGLSYAVKKLTGKNPGKVLFKSVLKKAHIYTLRVAICGGGPLSPEVFRAYNAAGINFIQGYGLTETAPIVALNPVEHFKIESVGKDFSPYEEIKILNPDEDGVGEIAVKGPMVMKGYYNMPEETAKVFTADGFFRTGDIGRLDSEHYLRLFGRAKNIIVTAGGKNVYPEEIEDMFQMCTDIQQIVVQAYTPNVNDPSEAIEALLYPSDSLCERMNITREIAHTDDTVRAVFQSEIDAVNRNLQPYARISRFTVLEEPLAMTTTMKVKRNYKK